MLTVAASGAEGQEDVEPGYSPFPVDAPLVDAPYNFDSPAYPSMQQAVRFSSAAYQMLHWGVGHLVNPYRPGWKGFWSRLAFLGFDALAASFPLFDAWTHEEFHRAVMGYRGISSYNDVYDLNIGASVIAVSHVDDDDLVRLKRDHPADMVRLPAAGVEGELQLALNLEKQAFFDGATNYHQMAILIAYFNSQAYVASGATPAADEMSDTMNEAEEETDVRDFVGHDFTSWVYDLHRPDEPYEARGIHPSGNGLDRYRKYSDLTAGEARYLQVQGHLMYLNFVDPALWGFPYFFDASRSVRWNASLQHYLTSFGQANNLNVFLSAGKPQVFATLSNFRNDALSLFGLDAELRRFPLEGLMVKAFSLRGQVFRQPTHQLYADRTSRLGGLGALTLFYGLSPRVETYFEVERKSPGWVAGTPYLDAATSGRVGLLVSAF